MDKPILFYEVRQQTLRSGEIVFVPAIVDREPSVPLDEIILRAIDRGLIAGLKPSAAKQVADAIALQMYDEFRQGRGVKFGSYFYARLYLDGTTDANGRLSADKNSINVRFSNGSSFKMSLDQFSWSNIEGGDIPGTDFLISDVDGAQRGQLKPNAAIMLNGVNLYKEDDQGTKVAFYEVLANGSVATEATAEITAFTSRGPNLLTFAWVAALEVGKSYFAVPSRSADGDRWFEGTGKTCAIVAAA